MLTVAAALWRGVSAEVAVPTARDDVTSGPLRGDSSTTLPGQTGQSGPDVGITQEKALAGSGEVAPQPGSAPVIGGLPLPPLGMNIIKTATLGLEIKKDRLDEAYQRALTVVQAAGGFAVSSGAEPGFQGPRALLLTVRVPSRAFESTLAQLRGLGKVKETSIHSEDVTQEFVDLNSRLRHWRAQEAVLLGLMAKAKTIEQSIAIQQHLSQIQMEIETITGRLRYLENQTSFSTIQLTLRAVPAKVKPAADPWGFNAAWDAARKGFAATVRTTLIALGYLSPVMALGLLGWLAYGAFSAATRRRARGSETS